MYQYQRDNWQLHSALEFYKRPDIKGGIEINEDIKQAVKFAMIYIVIQTRKTVNLMMNL